MSLINTPELRMLYAKAKSTEEHDSTTFWNYYFQKVVFVEVKWFYDQQKPVDEETDPLRRVDGIIAYFDSQTYEPLILVLHEVKHHFVGPAKVLEVEEQARQASAAYLNKHQDINWVYAITSIGTDARAWQYTRTKPELDDLDGKGSPGNRDAYIDMDSDDASRIRRAIEYMKTNIPSRVVTQTGDLPKDGNWHLDTKYSRHRRWDGTAWVWA